MTELKPCPFCGGKPHITGCEMLKVYWCSVSCSAEDHSVRVNAIGATDEKARALAIKKWNARHYPPEVEKAVDRMKPKKPERRLDGWNCPRCEMFQTHEWEVDQPPFCWNCGQALDWSNDE